MGFGLGSFWVIGINNKLVMGMAKCMGKWSDRTIENIKSEVEEELLHQLVETETLFYFLTDKLGMDNGSAQFWALKCFKGGKIFDSEDISFIISSKWKAYELNPKQATRFIKRHMKSSRIMQIDESPIIWELNGFATNQPPYIAGYEREVVT